MQIERHIIGLFCPRDTRVIEEPTGGDWNIALGEQSHALVCFFLVKEVMH